MTAVEGRAFKKIIKVKRSHKVGALTRDICCPYVHIREEDTPEQSTCTLPPPHHLPAEKRPWGNTAGRRLTVCKPGREITRNYIFWYLDLVFIASRTVRK